MFVGTYEQQLKLEVNAIEDARKEYFRKLNEGSILPPHFAIIRLGFVPFANAVRNWLNSASAGRRNGMYRVYLSQIAPEDLAFVTLWSLVCEHDDNLNATECASMVGKAIQDHIEYTEFKADHPIEAAKVERLLKRTTHKRHRGTIVNIARTRANAKPVVWDSATRAHIGSTMIELLISSTGMFEKKMTVSRTGNKRYAILPSSAVAAFYKRAHEQCSINHPHYMPCVIPPKPWEAPIGGGYYSGVGRMQLELVRSRQKAVQEHVASMDLSAIYPVINALQNTAWKIHSKVLHVVREVWSTETGMGLLPKTHSLELPPVFWETPEEFQRLKVEQPERIKEWKRAASEVHFKRTRVESRIRAVSRTIARAIKFEQYSAIYFPWSLDWRGRAYPVAAFLHPQGEDLAKGLLLFADGVPLGERGLFWLKVHGANSWACDGLDKRSFTERIEWVNANEAAIIDSGENPLDGERFWTGAEDPWQFLAFCCEYAEWVNSGRSLAFESHLPVSVDGSCNGLQHFAALGRDMISGAQVNLVHCDCPNDVYARVAESAQRLIEMDLNNYDVFKLTDDQRITYADMARIWSGKVNRKLVKRNVMTIPYGVTNIGMREQLSEVLLDWIDSGKLEPMDQKELFRATVYLASRISDAVGEVMPSVKQIMGWIRKCASVFNQAGMHMTWVTPHGFPVLQKYVKTKVAEISTYWGTQRIRLTVPKDTEKINTHKQTGGSAPNVIHSMDACHMFMTVQRCMDKGINSFAMVHDSFGCHAGHMDTMAAQLREAFDELYSTDNLNALYEQWKGVLPEEFANKLEDPCVYVGKDAVRTCDSPYFFN